MMLNKIKYFVISVLLLSSLSLQADGETLPELEGLDGKYHSLSEHIGKGKWTLVNVWSPTCKWCLRELPKIKQFNEDNAGKILTLGVTLDYPGFAYGKINIIKSFLQTNPLDYPIFLADLDSVSKLIGKPLVGIPQTTIFHPDGRAVARWAGDIELDEIYNFINNFETLYQEDPFDEILF